MSDFGEEIIIRTGNVSLQNKDNPMYSIINHTVGEWLQEKNDEKFFEQFFLNDANDKYLDLFGADFGIKRKLDENDEDYRKRIIYESLTNLTVNYLVDVYNLDLYVFVNGFDVNDNTLTSDNKYYKSNGYMAVADVATQQILNRRFVIGSEITWL